MSENALYACDAPHYDHVIMAMQMHFNNVDIVRRWEPTPQFYSRVQQLPIPKGLATTISRRVRNAPATVRNTRTFVASTIIPAISVHANREFIPQQKKLVTALKNRKLRSVARRDKYKTIQFMEGMGASLLKSAPDSETICECRSLHYRHYQDQPETLLGFPQIARTPAQTDLLDYEHNRATKLLVYSQASARSYTEAGINPEKLIVCPIPIQNPQPRKHQARDAYKIAFVGRGSPEKGLDIAVATVQNLGRPYKLFVAGPMPLAVQQWMKRFDFITYLGILNQEQLRDLYSSAAVYLAPSHESFGITAAHAAYHGCRIVCSDWTGIAEYVPSGSVGIVTTRQPEDWADSVFKASHLDQVRDFTEINGAFESLTIESVSSRLSSEYGQLISNTHE